jgi:hypothetical protein
MRSLFITLFSTSMLFAQAPSLVGVWKADLQKSKFAGEPPSNHLLLVEQKANQVTEIIGDYTQRGEQRSTLTYTSDGKPSVAYYHGVPTRITASWQGNTMNLTAEVVGAAPGMSKVKYDLSAGGKTLTVQAETTSQGKQQQSTLVLLKQPDSAADPLRKPEQTAEARFKNLKTGLKSLPVSRFIDNMHYYSYSLGKNCEFCHVAHKFDLDEKKEKGKARKMIAMTAAINEHDFDNKTEVRCFTCHEGREKPLSRPLFSDEKVKN